MQIDVRPTPFTMITEGPVHALVPDHWDAAPLEGLGSLRQGLMASPNLAQWQHLDGTVPGMEASWVDTTRVGVPSDYYYLAAKWPGLPRLASSEDCTFSSQRVIVDHRPLFARGRESWGDFAAWAWGTCQGNGYVNRFAYFIAAPSYGPVKEIGLPNSGLYSVVAVLRDGPNAIFKLKTMLFNARFGHATVEDLLMAARASAQRL